MKLLLLLDYDGTLTPIVKRPERAILIRKRREILRQIACYPSIKMAIISGRKLSDVKKLVGIPGIIYVGNHGFEMEIAGRHLTFPAAQRFIPVLKRVKSEIKKRIKIKGCFLEDKTFTLSLHYRQVAKMGLKNLKRIFKSALHPWRKKAIITEGKKVFEICPPVNWDKGKAVKWIINKLQMKNYYPIYIGDDRTDEDAFKALKGKGISIFVGNTKRTSADYSLKNVNAVYRFLQVLGAL